MSHRNSMYSIRRRTKMSKTSCPWYRNLTVYSVMQLKLKHVLTLFLSFCRPNALNIINAGFFVKTALLKGSYSYGNVDWDLLFWFFIYIAAIDFLLYVLYKYWRMGGLNCDEQCYCSCWSFLEERLCNAKISVSSCIERFGASMF